MEYLLVQLHVEYLNKEIEVIAFQVGEDDYALKRQNAKEAIMFFNTIQIDLSNFKFDRDEANER